MLDLRKSRDVLLPGNCYSGLCENLIFIRSQWTSGLIKYLPVMQHKMGSVFQDHKFFTLNFLVFCPFCCWCLREQLWLCLPEVLSGGKRFIRNG